MIGRLAMNTPEIGFVRAMFYQKSTGCPPATCFESIIYRSPGINPDKFVKTRLRRLAGVMNPTTSLESICSDHHRVRGRSSDFFRKITYILCL